MAFIISHKFKFIYCHIPKTGGTSICCFRNEGRGALDNLLGPEDVAVGHQHISYANGIKYKRWCNIRNPLDRAVSIYHDQVPLYYSFSCFKSFCDAISENGPYGFNHIWYPQSWFITDAETGNCLVDEFILFDSYEDEVKRFYDAIDVNARVLHLNKTDREPTENYYTHETEEIIRKAYSDDFILYEKAVKCKKT